jgi:hypothetical protein
MIFALALGPRSWSPAVSRRCDSFGQFGRFSQPVISNSGMIRPLAAVDPSLPHRYVAARPSVTCFTCVGQELNIAQGT